MDCCSAKILVCSLHI
uniref:Uncharacterized protein n=1 Tax=Anguilla anguilla TaxID=7936 RepID=A0A0E9RQX7_ANGAN